MSQAKCETFLPDEKVSQPTVLMTQKSNENTKNQARCLVRCCKSTDTFFFCEKRFCFNSLRA